MPNLVKNFQFLIFSVFILSKASAYSVEPIFLEQLPQAYKVVTPNNDMARKTAITYHHTLLEVNYSENYLILDLSEKEIKQLESFNFSVTPANKWLQKYKEFQSVIHKKRQEAKTKKLAGIPGYECYATVEETYLTGQELTDANPTLTEWIDIGDSWKKVNQQSGYDLKVLKITNKNIAGEKPILFIHSAMHAREYATAALTLDFAKLLLNNYQTDADIRWIIDYQEVHILFHMNPDGRKIAETGIYQRKNVNQNHCPANSVGVDLNRNFAFTWNITSNGSSGVECEETYRGASPESEPETQAVSNYIRSIYPDSRGENDSDAAPESTSGMHLDIHSYSELVLWPYGHTETQSPNAQAFRALGNKLAWFNGYTPQQSIGLYPTDGTSDDVSYGELGVAAFTFELGTQFFQSCSSYQNKIKPDNLKALIYAAKATAAPYKLGYGPDVINLTLNGSQSPVSLTQGNTLSVRATGSLLQSKQLSFDTTVRKIEYSIDVPVWSDNAEVKTLNQNDGNLESQEEVFHDELSTSNLAEGEHIIYFRAFDNEERSGVVTAQLINIAQNNSPGIDLTYTCNFLECEFDASGSADIDGTIDAYEWNFGDGSSTTGSAKVSHSYATAGTFSLSLEVEDNLGAIASLSVQVLVSEPTTTEPTTPASSSGGGGVSEKFIMILFLLLYFGRRREFL